MPLILLLSRRKKRVRALKRFLASFDRDQVREGERRREREGEWEGG
jgi:hypothetical protein